MKMRGHLATLILGVSFAGSTLFAQARQEVSYDWAPDQLAATFLYTVDDYSLQESPTNLEKTHLGGGSVEYASRHFYPWEIVGAIQYSSGQPLGQKLVSVGGGAGYCRNFKRWTPYARVLGGMARTSSNDEMYLYTAPKWGLAFNTSVGTDYQLTPRWGIRGVQLQE